MQDKIRVGVIPAAGAGTRFGYLTKLLPKALLPLYDRPIIHHVVDQMQNIGVEDIYIIVNVHKEKIIDYFKSLGESLRSNIYFIEQKVLNGTGESILLAEKYIKKEPFMVEFGDDCTVSKPLTQMAENFMKTNAIAMQGMVEENDIEILKTTCCAKLDKKGRIIEIIEKPQNPPYRIRGCSLFMFRPEIFAHIRKTPLETARNEREIVYTINNLAKNKKAYGHLINGQNININDSDELLKANQIVKKSKSKFKNEVKVLFK